MMLQGWCVCCGETKLVDAEDGHCARCASGFCGGCEDDPETDEGPAEDDSVDGGVTGWPV